MSDNDIQKESLAVEKKAKLDLGEQEIKDSKLTSSKDCPEKIKGSIQVVRHIVRVAHSKIDFIREVYIILFIYIG